MFLLSASMVAGGACSDSSEEEKAADELSKQCTLNSECNDPLVCAFQRCHEQCSVSRDCPPGQRCVKGEEEDSEDMPGVCQLPVETTCDRDSDCKEDQFCARDGECRDGCGSNDDCIEDQECTASGVCALPEEVEDGDVPGGGEGGSGGAAPEPPGGGGEAGGPPATSEGGAGGEGGSGTGGGGGGGKDTGTGGKVSSGGAPSGDDCSLPDVDNNDRDEATPYEFDTDVEACLQSNTDTDWYEFTTPDEPAQGGWLVAGLKDVGTDGGFYLSVFSASDNAQIRQGYGYMGANGVVWLPAAAGQTFRAEVKMYSAIPPEYTFYATYTPLEDAYEPNNEREEAAPIELGQPIQGHIFQGYSSQANPTADEDWYEVSLAAGSMQIALDLPETLGLYVYLYNDAGTQVGSYAYGTMGVDVMHEWTSLNLGTYYVVVKYYTGQMAHGTSTTAPDFELEPYTLTVTQD
jgi:hypothetical protein